MVFDIEEKVCFYCYEAGVDMRKGIHSLYGIIKTVSDYSALSGDAFVFIGSNLKSVKIIRWHKTGFLLYHKKLELGRYILPHNIGNTPFFELKRDDIDKLIDSIRYKDTTNELKREIILKL
jgi:transposase